ncbi:hypothetical protein [Nocardioides yefusunii]|uniref:Lipoprotein n=1 Tax=Nocardioides yefusunii TaxID=2500546 RepID=A0ABW1QYD4_9ACTN|nr:hypothetical protein [Nocardioides yefusunii]
MTPSLPRSARTGPSRRRLLTTLGVSTLTLPLTLTAGCDLLDSGDTGPESPTASEDQAILDEVTDSTRVLLDRVRATVAAGAVKPRRERALTALGDALQSHLDRFTTDPAPDASASAGATPTTAPSAAPAPAVGVAVLHQEAQTHQTLLSDAAGRTTSGAFARLLASAAAGVSQHLVALTPNSKTKDGTP